MEGLNWFDTAVMGFVQEYLHNPITDAVFPWITNLGEVGAVWILISLALLFFKKWRIWGFLSLLAMLLTFLTGEVFLKNVICRPRPFMDFPEYLTLLVRGPGSYSFPSGHSASSFTAATVLLYANKRMGICAMVLAALIAFSRVFLFVHYPTDVLAGAVLGAFFGWLTVFAYRRIQKKRTRQK